MRSGIARSVLRTEILIEAGFSTESGHATYSEDRLNHLIARTERLMASEYDWPVIHVEESVVIAANTRFVNLPSTISVSEIDTVHVYYGDDLLPVHMGIGAVQRSLYKTTQRATPIMRWEPNETQFEVWPIGGAEQTMLFGGQKAPGAYADDTSTCTLDGDVIVLRVAAEILGRDRKEDAALKLEQASRKTTDIIKGQAATRPPINLGRRPGRMLRPGIDYIPSGGS